MTQKFKESKVYRDVKDFQLIEKQIHKIEEAEREIDAHILKMQNVKDEYKATKETVLN